MARALFAWEERDRMQSCRRPQNTHEMSISVFLEHRSYFFVLNENGQVDLAFKLLLQESYPS